MMFIDGLSLYGECAVIFAIAIATLVKVSKVGSRYAHSKWINVHRPYIHGMASGLVGILPPNSATAVEKRISGAPVTDPFVVIAATGSPSISNIISVGVPKTPCSW